MTDTTTIADLIARWSTDEGKPYKGSLIDMKAYERAPADIGCMCAQGQVLHFVGGWSVDRLNKVWQAIADAETAKLLNISRAHAVLLRIVNDSSDGAPSVVLTDPAKVLGDQWSNLLDFWCHLDGMTNEQWNAAWFAAGDLVWDAEWAVTAREASWDAAGDATGDAEMVAAAWNASWGAARAAAGDAAWIAAGASNEIQGAEVMRAKGMSLLLLPGFGFADPSDIPPRPADYSIALNKELKS